MVLTEAGIPSLIFDSREALSTELLQDFSTDAKHNIADLLPPR